MHGVEQGKRWRLHQSFTYCYSRQMVERQAYGTLKDTITINILNFDYLQETDEFHSEFGLLEKKKHFSLTDALAMHYIDYPNKNKIQTFLRIVL